MQFGLVMIDVFSLDPLTPGVSLLTN